MAGTVLLHINGRTSLQSSVRKGMAFMAQVGAELCELVRPLLRSSAVPASAPVLFDQQQTTNAELQQCNLRDLRMYI